MAEAPEGRELQVESESAEQACLDSELQVASENESRAGSEGELQVTSENESRVESKDQSRIEPHVTVCIKPLHPKKQGQPVRAINEDDDGYDPYSDFHDRRVSEPMFERDPWD